MLDYDKIGASEGISFNKTNESIECDICLYWCFLDKDLKYEPYLCNSCEDLIQNVMNFDYFAIVSLKESDAINMMKNYLI